MVNPVWCTGMPPPPQKKTTAVAIGGMPQNDSGDNRWQRCAQMTPHNTVCAGGRRILYGEFSAQGNFLHREYYAPIPKNQREDSAPPKP